MSGQVVHMEIAETDSYLMLKLEHGEDIIGSIQEAVKGERSTLLLVTGLGMISDFELGFFDRGNYLRRSFNEPHELLALQGSVATEGDPRIHIHATVADTEHRAFGGHLMKGKVWMSNEIGMARLKGVVARRVFDSEKKVGVLHISAP
jgi:predicted DNA-binding protein with PD1-like motif